MRPIERLFLALILMLPLWAGVINPASAQEHRCDATYICVFKDANYTGDMLAWIAGRTNVDMSDYTDNEASSVDNNSQWWFRMYADDRRTVLLGCVAPYQQIPLLYHNDDMESYVVTDSCNN